ncbi:MAG: hypothetical protein KAW17_00835 [Candidatus Eisenbacteria sp.]|nr:hypothetical protein [Candidatus Eisenbacteria bacterium]
MRLFAGILHHLGRTSGLVVLLLVSCSGTDKSGWAPPALEIYAASYIGAVVRSLDGGKNWLSLGSDPRPLRAYRKMLALGPDGEVYVATSGGGLYCLARDNDPYVKINREPKSENISALHLDLPEGMLWIGTRGDGVFASGDGGDTWTQRNDGLTAYHVNCLEGDPGNPSRIYCGTSAGLFAREQQGTWREVPAFSGLDVRDLLVLPEAGVVYAALGWTGTGSCLMVSGNDGLAWEPADGGLPRSTVSCMACDRSDGRILAGTASGIYERSPGDKRWRRKGSNLSDVAVLALAAAQGHSYAATSQGFFGIGPGARHWVELSLGLNPSAVTDVILCSPAPTSTQQ